MRGSISFAQWSILVIGKNYVKSWLLETDNKKENLYAKWFTLYIYENEISYLTLKKIGLWDVF